MIASVADQYTARLYRIALGLFLVAAVLGLPLTLLTSSSFLAAITAGIGLLALIAAIIGLAILLTWGSVELGRSFSRTLDVRMALLFPAVAAGIALSVPLGGVDAPDPELPLYQTAAATVAALVVALSVNIHGFVAEARPLRVAAGFTLGITLTGMCALVSSLVAVARGDGSVVLFWLTVVPGGLFTLLVLVGFVLTFGLDGLPDDEDGVTWL